MTSYVVTALLALAAGAALGWLLCALRAARAREGYVSRIAELEQQRAADADKLAWREASEERLREAFEALASGALKANAETFLQQTGERLDSVLKQLRGDWSTQKEQFAGLVTPVEKTLKTLDEQVRALEQKREGAYRSIEQHIGELSKAHRELRDEAGHLRSALTTSSRARGQWGELQLRRVVELTGMMKHVDFDEQATRGDQRPDMVVHLPHQGQLPVDAKASLEDYLRACESQDDATRRTRLKAHAAAMRNHVRTLGAKSYWAQFDRAPEVVVMFVPNEACLAAAFEEDGGLIEYGLEQHVLIATPVTLYGLLKAIAYGWQQQSVAENAERIAAEGKDLCDRISVFVDHLRRSGKGLDAAVDSYNKAVGSLESRVMPSARRLREYGASLKEVEAPTPSERGARLPATEEGTEPDA